MIATLDSKHVNKDELILQWRQDPVLAAQEILGVQLDVHQAICLRKRWTSTRQVDVWSRGTGKTFMNAVFPVLRAILYPGHRVGLIGPSYRQSKLIFAEIEKLYEISPVFQQSCVKHPTRAPEACTVKFDAAPGRAGSYIAALPMGPDGAKIRGERFFDVVLDEGAQVIDNTVNVVVRGFLTTGSDPMQRVAFMREQRELVKQGLMAEDQVVMPENNKFIMSSTAYYQYNHLWRRTKSIIDLVLGEKRNLERQGLPTNHIELLGKELNSGQIPYRVISNGKSTLTAFTCVDPSEGFVDKGSIEDAKTEMSDYMFRMEYFSYFPPDSEGFFRRILLDKARSHNEFSPQLRPRRGMTYVMGIDPARHNDNFAIALFEVDLEGGVINLVRVFTWNNKDFPQMHYNVRKIIKDYDVQSICMDAGGGGTTIRDLLANQTLCPPGHELILEKDNPQHMMLTGKKILEPLFQFSNGNLIHDANHNLLNAIQFGKFRIAAPPPCGNDIWTQELEDADEEMEATIAEMSTIVKSVVGQRERWDTPTRTQRKDRYSAVLVGAHAALQILSRGGKGGKLATGGWA